MVYSNMKNEFLGLKIYTAILCRDNQNIFHAVVFVEQPLVSEKLKRIRRVILLPNGLLILASFNYR